MNPAPPVTSSLRGDELIQCVPEAVAPIGGIDSQQSGRLARIQHAVGGTSRGRRIFCGPYCPDRHLAIQKTAKQGFLLNGYRKIKPARDAAVAPVLEAADLSFRSDQPDRCGE